MQLLQRLKKAVYSFFDRLIKLSDQRVARPKAIPDPMWSLYCNLTFFLGDLGWLLRDMFRLSVYQAIGENLRIVFIGRETGRNDFENLFFANEKVEWKEIGRVFTWKKGKSIQKWCTEGNDLVIYEVSKLLPFNSVADYGFRIPAAVHQSMLLPENAELLLAGKVNDAERGRIHKAERNGYTYCISDSLNDFDHFYNEMYLPYITGRYSIRARLTPYKELLAIFKRGSLIKIMNGKDFVAASLVLIDNENAHMIEYGKYVGEPEDKTPISLLTYWFTIQWALSQGATRLDFGGSFPWCSNGVFRNKKRWKSKVSQYPIFHSAWEFFTTGPSVNLLETLNKIEFITEHQKNYYQVVLSTGEDDLPDDQKARSLSDALHSGLKGIMILKPYSRRVVEQD
jgi:hypothetical protein